MATYAIGDVQGCHDELRRLLERFRFDPEADRLWFVGDLVNRGPDSLGVLRYVRSLGRSASVVLGNHDLHLVALHADLGRPHRGDTLDDVLRAPDREPLVDWLRTRPLMHTARGHAMVHAGLLPSWSLAKARQLAREVERRLASTRHRDFLAHMYGSEPAEWDDALTGRDRLRVIVNAMTRLRFCTKDGRMDFRAKGIEAPAGMLPWFETRPARERRMLLFGHWSTLGLRLGRRFAGLDSGCVWGGALTAMRLEDREIFHVKCRGYQAPGD